jgi:hypothetical protein
MRYDVPTSQGEHGGEEIVAQLQDVSEDGRLAVMLDAHDDHVEEDHDEDGDLKPSRHGNVVKEGQIRIHGTPDHLARLLPAQFLNGRVVMLLALRQEHFKQSTLVL